MTLRLIQTLAFLLTASSLSTATASAQRVFPRRELFDESTGFMESIVGNADFRGSAVVARDPRLIYSCGHLFFDKGQWATDYGFSRAWHNEQSPDFFTSAFPRGYRFFTEYSGATRGRDGQNSIRAFSYDFTVFYGSESFGPAIETLPDGAAALTSGNRKRIVGYPASIEANGADGAYFQHSTDWFNIGAQLNLGNFWDLLGVTTGGGNSGGPVFVSNTEQTSYSLAGILVSGGNNSAGVYAINPSSEALADAALGGDTTVRVFTNEARISLPDAAKGYVTRRIEVTGSVAAVSDLKFSLGIAARRRGDLDVFLRSPSGRIRIIAKPSKQNRQNLSLDRLDYSSTFRGSVANGTWQLKMRDAVMKNRSTFVGCDLYVTASGR